jgi:hypothetical protein
LALVSVAGATSRAGKTALAASLLTGLPSRTATAVKFTTTEDVFERCPRGTPCVVCDIDVPFRIVTEADVLREPGTDTDRLAAAGARRVIWAIARSSAVSAAWRSVAAMLEPGLQVMEGSTIALEAKPDLTFFVVHPFLDPARWKETSPRLLADADAVVVNRPAGESRPPSPQVLEAIRARRRLDDLVCADVTLPLAQWAPALTARFRGLL